MAEDTVDQAAVLAGLDERPCPTESLPIHGAEGGAAEGDLAPYGADASVLRALMDEQPELNQKLHPARPVRAGQVVWAARHEFARTVEDVLSRRTRELILDARASVEMAPQVASLLAAVLGRGEDWEREQVAAYEALAEGYLVPEGFVVGAG